jgi:1,4-alpha-glucan branching enzyme
VFKALNKALKPKMKPGMGPISHEKGTTFRVWAPNAQKVFVTGDFNDWNDSANPLTHEGDGYWATDVARAKPGDEYKFVLINGEQKLLPHRSLCPPGHQLGRQQRHPRPRIRLAGD